MTVPITSDYKKPEERLVKWDNEETHSSGRPGWGDGKTQCYFLHLETNVCENTRCYYVPKPEYTSCLGYVNCPIYKRLVVERADLQRAADESAKRNRAFYGNRG